MAWGTCEGLKEYVPNWHIDVICEHLEAVYNGEIRKLLINMPPRHMKSLLVSVMGPAYDWIRHPHRQYLFSSYSHALSIRDTVKSRRVIQSPLYQAAFSEKFQITSDQNTKLRYDNNRGGYRIATSVDGMLTGEGGDIISVDDPHNVREAESEAVRQSVLTWWSEAMSSRLNNPKTGSYIVVMQRVHEGDLTGHILSQEQGWTHLCLPARYESNHPHVWVRDPRKEDGELLWTRRFGEKELHELEERLGPYATAGQLQQRPAPREGGMFQRSWFEIVDAAPIEARRVRAWDFAATKPGATADPDYTATVRMSQDKNGIYYIESAFRMRDTAQKVEAAVRNSAIMDGKRCAIRIPQDPGQAGKAQSEYYVRILAGWVVQVERETGEKTTRAGPLSSQAEAGNVKLVKGDWNEQFLAELEMFPNGLHDDYVDSASGAFNALANMYSGMLEFYAVQHQEREEEMAKRVAAMEKQSHGDPRVRGGVVMPR